jgi:hypothetical protein
MARPSEYDEEVAKEICGRLASGESLRAICTEDAMPAERTVYYWIAANEGFLQQYARARRTWAESQLEEIVAIADDKEEDPQSRRIRIDTRKWAMGKLNGKYSDKVAHVGGDEDDAPIKHSMTVEFVKASAG